MSQLRHGDDANRRSPRTYAAYFVAAACVVFAATVLCVAQLRLSSYVAAFWIPDALLLAAWFQASSVRSRAATVGGGVLGLACGEVAAYHHPGLGLGFTAVQLFELAVTVCTARLALGATVDFRRRASLVAFIAVATVAGPIAGAGMGGFLLHATASIPYPDAVLRWFLAHACGMLVFGAFGLIVTREELRLILRAHKCETALVMSALGGVTYVIFAQATYPCLFAVFPFLMLAAFRLRFAGAAFAPLIVAAIATALTCLKSGPVYVLYAANSSEAAIHYLQVFLVFVVLTTLPVAVVLRDRDALVEQRARDEAKIWANEELYRQLEFHAPIGITIVGLDGRFLRTNPALSRMFAYGEAELLDKHVGEVTHPADVERSRAQLERLVRGEVPAYQLEKRYVRKDGSTFWASLNTALIRDSDGRPLHIVAQILDISERRAREASIRDAKDVAEAALAEQRARAAQEKFVNDATLLMQDSIDVHGTLDRLARHLIERLGDLCIVAVFGPPGDETPPIIGTAARSEYLLESMGARQMRRKSRGELMQLFDIAEDASLASASGGGMTLGTYLGEPRTLLLSVLRSEAGVVGFILTARPASESYLPVARVIVDEIARRLQAMLEVARSFQRERKLAQELQHVMLPTILASPNQTHVDALYLPASGESDVGGDWFDSFTLPDGRLFVSLGDVAGHGLRAAGAMGQIRQMIRAYALVDPEPVSVAARCDRAISYLELPTTTAIFGLFDTVVGSFVFVQAGHPAPILVSAEGDVVMLDDAPRTLPLGLIDDLPIEQGLITLENGSHVVMYTDGLIEYERDVIRGEQALCEAVAAAMRGPTSGQPAQAIARNVFRDVVPRDDTAILVLSAPAPSLASLSLQAKATPVNLRVLRQRIASFASLHGVRGSSLARLEVAVGEALTNVLEHAYHFESGNIAVYGVGEGDRVRIEIADNGRWRPERDEGRGYGLSVMREFCDDVQVLREPGGTRVRLTQEVPA